jgi:hypothetical protein
MTYTHTDHGASHAKDHDENIFDVLREIEDENPDAKRTKIDRIYVEAILDDRYLARSFIKTYLPHVRAAVNKARKEEEREREDAEPTERGDEQAAAEAPAATEGAAEAPSATEAAADEDLARAIFDFEMPNKKKLRDCTGEEVGKFGAGFTKLASMVKPHEIVGEVLTDAQVRKAVLG